MLLRGSQAHRTVEEMNKKEILLLLASLQKIDRKLKAIFIISFSKEPIGAKTVGVSRLSVMIETAGRPVVCP